MNSPSLSQIGHWEQVQKAIRDISGFGALSEFLQSQSCQVLIIVFTVTTMMIINAIIILIATIIIIINIIITIHFYINVIVNIV